MMTDADSHCLVTAQLPPFRRNKQNTQQTKEFLEAMFYTVLAEVI
jgi:hypothetical protein